MKNLQPCRDIDEDVLSLIDLVHHVERLQMHLEFTLAVYNSSSELEVLSLKDKFHQIKQQYEQTKSSEDVATIPIKHLMIIIHNFIFFPFKKMVQNCFYVDNFGETALSRTFDNLAKIKIFVSHFPSLILSSFLSGFNLFPVFLL